MKDLSLSNLLRYVFPSFVVYAYIYIVDRKWASEVLEPLGSFQVVAVVAFAFLGSVIYFVYRSFIYQSCIMSLQDKYRYWKRGRNYRTYFRDEYGVDTHKAQQLYVQIKSKYLQGKYDEAMKENASGIHLTYIAGIIALIFSVCTLWVPDFTVEWGFLVACLVLFLAAFFYDKSYEDIELLFILSLYQQEEVDSFVRGILSRLESVPHPANSPDAPNPS